MMTTEMNEQNVINLGEQRQQRDEDAATEERGLIILALARFYYSCGISEDEGKRRTLKIILNARHPEIGDCAE